MNTLFKSSSVKTTIDHGRTFAQSLREGDIIAVNGPLGAGKTHWIKGLASGLGATEEVTSPTFSLVHEYVSGHIPLYHFDFYRLEDARELTGIGFENYLFGSGICVMEWAEKVSRFLPAGIISVELELTGPHHRNISVVQASGKSSGDEQ